ncbi:MAG: hypothetical protein AAF804_02865 [Bacteroidota bacterium]
MKPYSSIFTLLVLVGLCHLVTAQEVNEISFSNVQDFEENRYDGVQGNPYLFEDWAKATLVDGEGLTYPDLLANYNGYEQELEIKTEGGYMVLDHVFYPSLILEAEGETYSLVWGKRLGLKPNWVISLYQGDTWSLAAVFRTVMSEHTIQNVGETIEVKRFKSLKEYYLIQAGQAQAIKMNKRKILTLLGQEKEINSFLKEKQLKLNSEAGLIATLQFLDQQSSN